MTDAQVQNIQTPPPQTARWAWIMLHAIRIALAGVLIYASLDKIQYPLAFFADVYSYQLLPARAAEAVAMVLPWLELLVGICLLIELAPGGAALLAAALGLMFVVAQSWAMARGLEIGCGCFGTTGQIIGWTTFIRALLVFAAAIVVLGDSLVSKKRPRRAIL